MPTISIVTPSFNQAAFIEETIRSVLLQGWPSLEYVIIDGGSTDGTVSIIERYAPWLTAWVSEPDAGQSHAINKGFDRCSGDVMAWLNSDDTYLPNTLAKVAARTRSTDWIVGDCVETDESGAVLRTIRAHASPDPRIERCLRNGSKPFNHLQPSMFWRRRVWDAVGSLDRRRRFVMDADWTFRALIAGFQPEIVEASLSTYRLHDQSKTRSGRWRFLREYASVFLSLGSRGIMPFWPAVRTAHDFWVSAQKAHSDTLYDRGSKLASVWFALMAWAGSGKLRCGCMHRIRRIFP